MRNISVDSRASLTGMDERAAWDEQYLRKGALWRGNATLHFQVSRGEKVLELGCGNGKSSMQMAAAGADVVCVDFSLPALQQCAAGMGGRADIVHGDVLQLPFVPGSFDLVNCSHVLEHLMEEGRRNAALQAADVLKSGGRLEFQAFSVYDMRYGVGESVEEGSYRRGDGILYHYFADDEVEILFPKLRLARIQHRTIEKRYHGKAMVRDMVQAEFVKP